MPKGRTFNGQEATQKVLDMSTDSNMESESEVYSDTVLCWDRPKRVYSQKCGHTDSSMVDKDKLSDDSFEFQDDELQMSPQRTLQNLCSLRKRMYSRSPLPSTSTSKPPMRHTSMLMGLGEDMVSSPLSPAMPTHSCHTSNPGDASGCGTLPSAAAKCPRCTSTPVASAPKKSTPMSATHRHSR